MRRRNQLLMGLTAFLTGVTMSAGVAVAATRSSDQGEGRPVIGESARPGERPDVTDMHETMLRQHDEMLRHDAEMARMCEQMMGSGGMDMGGAER